jgi:hypothetical protein
VGWRLTERGATIWQIVRHRLLLEQSEIEHRVPHLKYAGDELVRVVDALSREKGSRTAAGLYERPEPTESEVGPHFDWKKRSKAMDDPANW